ncbi:oligosaccharide flippase family protein [Vibrio breoganii]|uniref:oligosaccharide flippase family protein n=1 Tax=Vibrio breoganii TaxID=553239 RepID=UPI0018E47902|nr:oligosaccharide flippase family protein [Vibrio breoganii]
MKFFKYSFMSFLSMVLPALFPILVLALSARYLAAGDFGTYLIIMTILGYSGLLELGMSRALIKQFSSEYRDEREANITLASGFYAMLGLGLFGTVTLLIGSQVAEFFFSLPSSVLLGIKISSFALPAILLTQVFHAYLEGSLRYGSILKIKLVSSILEASLLITTLLINGDLYTLLVAFCIGKYVTLVLAYIYCSGLKLIERQLFSKRKVGDMVKFGGWLTISSIVGPVMVYFDRFFVSGEFGLEVAEQYLAVSELAIKIAIIPTAIARVVFVLMARLSISENKTSTVGYKSVLVSVSPLLLSVVLFAEPALNLMFDNRTTDLSVLAFRILCVGLFFNAIAQIPFAKLLASGRSKTTAKIHLYELLPYLALLYFSIEHYGIVGVSVVWALRCFVDCLVLIIASRRMPLNECRQ